MDVDRDSALAGPQRREEFRVDVALPLAVRNGGEKMPILPSRLFPVSSGDLGAPPALPEIGSATANPALCRMLVAFSSRLDRLLSVYSLPSSSRPPSPATVSLRQLLSEIDRKLLRLMESVHLPPAEAEVAVTPVSLSANGIKFATDEAYSQDDFVEIRLFLGGTNPCWLVACGRVVRVWGLPAGRREVAASFVDMDESIRQAIRTYGLQLQRDDLMRLRGWG